MGDRSERRTTVSSLRARWIRVWIGVPIGLGDVLLSRRSVGVGRWPQRVSIKVVALAIVVYLYRLYRSNDRAQTSSLVRTSLRQFRLALAHFLARLLHLLDRRRARVDFVAHLDRSCEIAACTLASVSHF